MQSAVLGFARDTLPTALVLILLASLLAMTWAMKHWEGALKQPGHDRDRLLRMLRLGGDLRRIYVYWVTRALNRVDRFLGDSDKADLSLRPWFGRWPRRPYWTGRSFDKCALIAVVYPLGSVVVTWLVSGEAGEVGSVLRLPQGAPVGQRLIVGDVIVWAILAYWPGARTTGWRQLLWYLSAVAVAVAFAVALAFAGAGAGAGAAAAAAAAAGAVAVAVAVAVAGAVAFAFAGAFAGAVAVAGAAAVAGVASLAERAERRRRLGPFWLAFWPVAVVAVYAGLWLSSRFAAPDGPLLLLVMLGLVPLVNIPFDWASVGVTRLLLRKGCERDAISPLWFALIDFGCGLLLLLGLAAALVISLHLADVVVAQARHGAVLMDVPARLIDLYDKPLDPGNWWVYLTLFSTLIPSALNLLIGMVSVATWWAPKHRQRLIRKIGSLGERKDMEATQREIALALGLQAGIGTFLAGVLIWGAALLLLYAGGLVLFWFLWLASWLEWLML